jgi:lipid-A-disaccharide synthase-like uncharacterized protein
MNAVSYRLSSDTLWIAIGLLGQVLFAGRFILQWFASERSKRSVVPLSFWYFSIGGAAVLLAYAIHKRDVVFIVGQSTGFIIYVRNLVLIRRERTRLAHDRAADRAAGAATS